MQVIQILFISIFNDLYSKLKEWDVKLLTSVYTGRVISLDFLFILITDSAPIITYLAPLFILIVGFLKKREENKRKIVLIYISILLSVLITGILKFTINRARPFVTHYFIIKLTNGATPSFPSGHTSDAFALAASISFAFPKWYFAVPLFIWACMVGYSRMSLGVHYPSDVLAGMIVSMLCCYLVHRIGEWNKKSKNML